MRGARAGFAWCALGALLAAGALVGSAVAPTTLDWQPALAATEPWRAWSAVFVHYSPLHLGANLAGAALVAALGAAGRVPTRSALAWLAAWPLTQAGLLIEPALAHYGGLSGVLHAGVAVIAIELVFHGTRRLRTLGDALIGVLALKVLSEAPWVGPVQHPAGWDIAVAPLAHATGLLAGVFTGLGASLLARRGLPLAARRHA